jgi:outer membrane protein OmpA-like peptidoglycan-associated protein
MRLSTTYLLLPALFLSVSFFSCVPQQKAVSHKQQLAVLDSQLSQHSKKLKELDAKRQNKQEQNEIDDTASSRIQKYIGVTTAEIDKLIAQNSILIGNTVVEKDDWNKLKEALTLSQKTSKMINDKVNFINDLINRNMVVKLEQDVLFEPGKYTVAPAVADAIGKFFEPAAREIDQFTQKYPDFPLSLVITAKGYADGTSIVEGTPLYKALLEGIKLSGTTPDSKELNKELSRKRASSVIELFQKYTKDRSTMGGSVKNVMFLTEGKGDALPSIKITDYSLSDPRRRIVLLFWSVFPD